MRKQKQNPAIMILWLCREKSLQENTLRLGLTDHNKPTFLWTCPTFFSGSQLFIWIPDVLTEGTLTL